MATVSNNVKVVLYRRDIRQHGYVTRRDSITVRSYSYTLKRSVDSDSVTLDCGSSTSFFIKLRVGTKDDLRMFYEHIQQSSPFDFSLVFNAEYDDYGYLSGDGGVLVVTGYVVAIDESYDRERSDAEGKQMSVTLKILVKQLQCIGGSRAIVHSF